MRSIRFVCILLWAPLAVGQTALSNAADPVDSRAALEKLANSKLPTAEHISAYRQLEHTSAGSEEAKALVAIVNSSTATKGQIALAASALLQRHVRPGMTLREIAALLDKPKWLRSDAVGQLSGNNYDGPPPPLADADGETLFGVAVVTGKDSHLRFAVYMRIGGPNISADALVRALNGMDRSLEKLKLTAIKLEPSDPARAGC